MTTTNNNVLNINELLEQQAEALGVPGGMFPLVINGREFMITHPDFLDEDARGDFYSMVGALSQNTGSDDLIDMGVDFAAMIVPEDQLDDFLHECANFKIGDTTRNLGPFAVLFAALAEVMGDNAKKLNNAHRSTSRSRARRKRR